MQRPGAGTDTGDMTSSAGLTWRCGRVSCKHARAWLSVDFIVQGSGIGTEVHKQVAMMCSLVSRCTRKVYMKPMSWCMKPNSCRICLTRCRSSADTSHDGLMTAGQCHARSRVQLEGCAATGPATSRQTGYATDLGTWGCNQCLPLLQEIWWERTRWSALD